MICFAFGRGCSNWSSVFELRYFSSSSDCVDMSPSVFQAVRKPCWRHMQCLRVAGEEVEEVAQWFQEELEPCKRCLGTARGVSAGLQTDFGLLLNQVVDARAGPGFKVTKPKKIKNSDGKKKSKLKRLHKLKRQGWLFKKVGFQHRDVGKKTARRGRVSAFEIPPTSIKVTT